MSSSSSSSTLNTLNSEDDGYGSIPGNESLPLMGTSALKSEESNPECTLCVKRTSRLVFGALLGILVACLGGGVRIGRGGGSIRTGHFDDGFDDMKEDKDRLKDFSALLDESFRLSPMEDMGMLGLDREYDALPSSVWGSHLEREGHPLPTNSWYLNLVSHRASIEPNDQTRVYTVPYIIDTASPYKGMEGLRVHWPVVQANTINVQMVDDFKNALCLGAEGFTHSDGEARYKVQEGRLSHLGVGLEWTEDFSSMSSSIIRGMPYATMEYNLTGTATKEAIIPTLYSYNGLSSNVQIDRDEPFAPDTKKRPKLACGVEGSALHKGNTVTVQSHLHLHMINSDFTWMVFFNKPVRVKCTNPNGVSDRKLTDFKLSIVDVLDETDEESSNLVIRVALLDQCTTGESTIKQHCLDRNAHADPEGFENLIKTNAHAIPRSPTIHFEYDSKSSTDEDVAKLHIDWDATSTTQNKTDDLLMFALPHHLESLYAVNSSNIITDYCVHSFHGNTCLIQNSKWTLEESLGSPLSFFAPRPPKAELIPALSEYLKEDISFQLSDNMLRGASDTYFSGKILARLARVIVIAAELKMLAEADSVEDIEDEYYGDSSFTTSMLEDAIEAASKANLPSSEEIENAVEMLKAGVTVWLKSDAEAPYIYDQSWGGLVNCGCRYHGFDDHGYCENAFPDCPALHDVNEDFGNGYYNDHHYHYGYHVYAAAVAARMDHSWGRKHFDEILLYIRDFANPYEDDAFFPQYRSKDWFLGSSWASGIVSAENSPHGRNEESSSEAISAYEGVTLFGSAMVDAFEEAFESDETFSAQLETAKLIRGSGQLLTASEIHATNRYWHVWSSDTHNSTYPAAYKPLVVGMLYDTMATFQTWFAPWDVVSYGIQLIPLTPVAETRDDIEWAKELYPLYEKACKVAGDFCVKNGWSILQAGLLATTGNHTDALEQAENVPSAVFSTEGGVGNSMSNTIWYIATRKSPAE